MSHVHTNPKEHQHYNKMEDNKLENFNIGEEKDKLVRFKISLEKSRLGCGQRFEYGDYINGKICVKECLCDDCDKYIEENETEVSKQETLILGIKIAQNGDVINKIKKILNNDKDNETKVNLIKNLL